MKFPENYDSIISEIEELVEKGYTDIPVALSQHAACNIRLLGDAFQFITGITLAQYIRQRRLLRAVACHLKTGKSLEEVSTEFGFSDAAAMSKAFKRVYGVSPSQVALEDLGQSRYQPLSSEIVLSDRRSNEMPEEEKITTQEPKTMFGVTSKQFASVRHILEVNAVYGLSEEGLELVSYLSNDCHVRLDVAFNFVEELETQIRNGDFYTEHDLYDFAEVCCVYDADMDETGRLLDILEASGFMRLHDVPEGFCDVYFSETNKLHDYDVYEILAILNALKAKGYGPQEFDYRMTYDFMHDGDPVESILCYEEDDDGLTWEDLQMPEMDSEPDIWELSEEDYYRQ